MLTVNLDTKNGLSRRSLDLRDTGGKTMPQVVYNPADYCFEWIVPTVGEPVDWYKWNRMESHRFALRDRIRACR